LSLADPNRRSALCNVQFVAPGVKSATVECLPVDRSSLLSSLNASSTMVWIRAPALSALPMSSYGQPSCCSSRPVSTANS